MKMQKRFSKKGSGVSRQIFGLALIVVLLLGGSYFYLWLKENFSSVYNSETHITSTVASVSDTIETVETATTDEFIDEKVFGYTSSGREISGYVIGNGENVIFLFGSIHGNEMGTADLLETLVDTIKADNTLVSTDYTLVVIPIANPDGYYDRTDKLNANEVNLNLNFATSDWEQYGPEGTYAGDYAFSESESQTIAKVVEDYDPNFMIAYHSYGSLVNPECYHGPSQELAWWYAEMTGYTYFDDDSWNYTGTATKWFVETTGNAAITVELTDNSSSDWSTNKNVLLTLIGGSYYDWGNESITYSEL